MDWLSALGATGAGMTNLVGSPQQQIENRRRAEEFGQNMAMRQDALAETRRQHDLQYEMVDYTPDFNTVKSELGLPPDPPGTHKYPRSDAGRVGSILNATINAARERRTAGADVSLGDLIEQSKMFGGTVTPPAFTRPEEIAPTVGENFNITKLSPDTEKNAAILARKVNPAQAQHLLTTSANAAANTIRAKAEERREKADEARAARDDERLQIDRDRVSKAHPPTSDTLYAEAIRTPAGQRTPEHKEIIAARAREHERTPLKEKDLTKEKTDQIKLENLQEERAASNVEEAMAAGMTIPTKILDKTASSLERAAQQYFRDGEDDLAKEMRQRAVRIRKYKPGGKPSVPGATPAERARNKFGIQLQP